MLPEEFADMGYVGFLLFHEHGMLGSPAEAPDLQEAELIAAAWAREAEEKATVKAAA
ncbi:MAG: hypothetical protein JNJ73_17245 [Hyphomonadaceae bacterium]|nr:hypothetical protein [Hyphomonadaceae bacterium]